VTLVAGSRVVGRRLLALDGLRGLAAVAIVIHHAWMFSAHGMTLADRALDELRLGVTLFFVLSGYLLYGPFVAAALDRRDQPSRRRYALKRAARILPAYWLVLIGAFALTAAVHHPMRVEADQLLLFVVFAQNQVEAVRGQLDPPLWSLAVEASFYVLLPVVAIAVARLGRDRRAQLLLVGALGAAGLLCCALGTALHWPRTVTDSLLTTLPLFACGMAVAAATHGRSLSTRTGTRLALAGLPLILAGAIVESAAGLQAGALRFLVSDFPAAAGFALVVAALVATPMRARPLVAAPVLFAGTISYGLYLWHFPVIYGLHAADLWPSPPVPAMALVLALTFVPATISWFLLERPVLAWAHRRRRPAVSAPSASPRRPDSPRAAAQPG
jgi:peptidoglycan/LPS O-acetylase OafA/YrhL